MNFVHKTIVELASNEFYDYNDYFGLFEQDPEPKEFLSIDKSVSTVVNLYGMNITDLAYPDSNQSLPFSEVQYVLSNKKRRIERQAYTFMILVGDIGGFTGAIIGLPSLILSWYSNRKFSASFFS